MSKHCTHMIRIVDGEGAESVPETELNEEGFLEDNLREWILSKPIGVLGENIMIIGREVSVSVFKDRIDLLGIDREGNVVIIELKRGTMKGSDDFQGLKYAAFASQWGYDELRDQFNRFKQTRWGESLYSEDIEFNEILNEFCNEDYALNKDQRIILVGESIRERLGMVIQWLSERDIDISAVEVTLMDSEGTLYLDSEQIIPIPENRDREVHPDTTKQPWKKDGEAWHIEEITDEPTGELLQNIITAISDIESLSGPEWAEEYVSFKQGRRRRVVLGTEKSCIDIDFLFLEEFNLDVQEISEKLDVAPNQVLLGGGHRGGKTDIRITCKPGEAPDLEELKEFSDKLV